MANPYEKFDEPEKENPYAQFDRPARKSVAEINKPLPEEVEARRRVRNRAGAEAQRFGVDTLSEALVRSSPLTLAELPIGRMRQSKNVYFPEAPNVNALGAMGVMRGSRVPASELYRQTLDTPIDQMAIEAGILDALRQRRR